MTQIQASGGGKSDSIGRSIIVGPAANDAPESGNPIQIGGSIDETSPIAAGEGDVRRIRVSPDGNIRVELTKDNIAVDANAYNADGITAPTTATLLTVLSALVGLAPDGAIDRIRSLGDVALDGLGQLCVATAVPGAGVVTSTKVNAGDPSSTRVTVATPTSGTRIRMVSIILMNFSATTSQLQVYFDTGANIDTDISKAIGAARLDNDHTPNLVAAWPDGAGPVGAVDDVISLRATPDVTTNAVIVCQYREE